MKTTDAWNNIKNLIKRSGRDIMITPGDQEAGNHICTELQIPDATLLHAVVSNTTDIIVDRTIHLLGQDTETIHGVRHYNREAEFSDQFHGLFLIGYDIVGGLFAIDFERFATTNNIWYFAPDTLEWEDLGTTYEAFVNWCINGDIDSFYSSFRWHSWEKDVMGIGPNEAIFVYPFLWAKECNVESASKKVVRIDELIGVNFNIANGV